MDKTYQPGDIEERWYKQWETAGYFEPSNEGKPYCIMIPPPNVTGTLHMGHAFQDTIMDTLIRYHRMQGRNTLWQPGTDHAGIATQMVVERQLEAEGISRHDLGREAFLEKVWEWKEKSGNTISNQLRRMGSSLDWESERFTMDEGLSEAVIEVFVSLHSEGLIFRGKRLVNWDPVLHTAVSDLEVISEEENGHLWHFRYPLADGKGHLTVATTRPETMLGDAAVAVHPDDERYGHLIGKMVSLPLTGRHIPVIADEYVDPDFGSGCVKITPAHDFNDYEVWSRHKEELGNIPHGGLINIFTVDAHIKASAGDDLTFGHKAVHKPGADGSTSDADTYTLLPEKYRGMDRFAARKAIVADLDALGLLEKTADHKLMVPRGDRSGQVIEPYLTDQWFVKTGPLAKPAIEAVEDGRIKFIPENWSKTYFEWMNNIQDWCISRQLWWGHRIPAWYGEDGSIYVAHNEAEAREKYNIPASEKLIQDPDVLDTWFSSALWPFSTLGWPNDPDALKTFYPGNVLVTGFDIIFFWVARMIMMGIKFAGDVPFREVYIHGLIRDQDGQKMSKSKGNVLDPLDLIDGIELEPLVEKRTGGLMQPALRPKIEKSTRQQFPDGIPEFGTDALRFTFAALASNGRDVRFDLNRISGYRNFCNKIWNATRYALMNTEGDVDCATGQTIDPAKLSLPDRWILSQLGKTIGEVQRHIEAYRLDLAAKDLYEFTWNDYCDWYLELSKPILQDDNLSEAEKALTRNTLITVLEALLRCLHPITPFITEEIWQKIAPLAGKTGPSIMLQPYPNSADFPRDEQSEEELLWIREFVLGLRQIRGEMDISPGKQLNVLMQDAAEKDRELFVRHEIYLSKLARLESSRFLEIGETPPASATALLGGMKILVPMAGLIDVEAERARLSKAMEKVTGELKKLQGKLSNQAFVAKAPPAVVDKERQRAKELEREISQLNDQLELLTTIE
ncbi:MAG: valyl-tRNA synthetase [Gammaproteobacteria bacterium]|jgi:valyl-tRNA synthetase|tara:strand:+ start:1792 stop:4680 length:2889 start_codon:yes stop_codon:yes gene_type:complete